MKRILLQLTGLLAITLCLIRPLNAFAQADLTVVSVGGPAAAGTAQIITLTNILANIGTNDVSGNWQYRIYLSTNASVTTNNTVLTTVGLFNGFLQQTSMTNYDTVTVPISTTPGTYFFGVIVDFDNRVTETTKTNNNKSSGPVAISIGPDLTVPSVGGPATAGTAQSIVLTNILSNIGVGTAGTWWYRIYLSTNSTITTNATVLTTQGSFPNFPAQSSVTNFDTVTIPSGTTPGNYFFGVIIDYNNLVIESSESNNAHASGPVTISIGPDLAVQAIGSPAVAGTAQTVTLTNILANIGVGAVASWNYRIYLATNAATPTNGLVLTTQGNFIGFAAQTTVTNYDSVFLPDTLATGTYYFAVLIDPNNTVAESTKTNNIRVSGPVSVGIGPDLTVLAVSAPNYSGPGQTITLVDQLANIGLGSAGNWSYRVYLTTNAVVTTNDTVLTTQGAFPGFPAHSTVTNSDLVTVPADTPPGNYYLGIIIDYNNVILESNEGNNSLTSRAFPIGPLFVAISPATNAVSLGVAGLAIANGYSIQYNSSLTGTNAWTTGTVFTAQGLATNFLDNVVPVTTSRFYRIVHQ